MTETTGMATMAGKRTQASIRHSLLSVVIVGYVASVAGWASAALARTPPTPTRPPTIAPTAADALAPPAAPISDLAPTVDAVMASIRAQYGVAGIAVGVTIDGRHHFFNYGQASRESKRPVSRRTLFEIGSASKTFAAAVAAEARARGLFRWQDTVSNVVPTLRGSAFDEIRMWQLGTHSAGLPMNLPDGVGDEAHLLAYLQHWTPPQERGPANAAAGLQRRYSNVGIGVLGWAAAQRVGRPYADIMQADMLPALGMRDTFLTVSRNRMLDYAQGYTRDDRPIRLHPDLLADEAYGVKSSAADLVRYLDLQIEAGRLPDTQTRGTAPAEAETKVPVPVSVTAPSRRAAWLAAFAATQRPWLQAGTITQDLMWEQYVYPVSLAALQAGNGNGAALKTLPATLLTRKGKGANVPDASDAAASPIVWINKTGSTNGFGTYLVFIPQRRIGVVMLFNKNVPIEARVAAAARIVSVIDPSGLRP
ncbi:serine hydrolase [Robbsia sp. KACC 23696]|uniref:serine hydrolase n=1 Tax=Robbsia sp. KACC 23696 TaxID=3149231 RepID=UPI00325BD77D